jgi:hypothetical protein
MTSILLDHRAKVKQVYQKRMEGVYTYQSCLFDAFKEAIMMMTIKHVRKYLPVLLENPK